MNNYLTECGIPGVGTVPYGIHICHFYPSREELLEGLIPYFVAGLASNERCIWVAAPPLIASDIICEIARTPDLQEGFEAGALTVVDAVDWYGDLATLNLEDAVKKWTDEEERALASGYRGLRITENTNFVSPRHWAHLMKYEKLLHASLQGRQIVACCSYSRLECQAVDTLEAVFNHDAALDRTDRDWQVMHKPVKLARSHPALRNHPQAATDASGISKG